MKPVLVIRTPEGVEFSHEIASPISRALALMVDFACMAALSGVAAQGIRVLFLISPEMGMALSTLVYFIISIGYSITAEWYWRGQTVGKRLFQLRVIDSSGLRLDMSQVIVRNLLRAVDALPFFYLVGGVTAWFHGKNQRLGDIAAGTVVVRNPRQQEPDLTQVATGRFNSLRAYPHLEARLRQRISPAEASIYLQAVLRRDEFDPAERLSLFEELAARLRVLVPFPDEAVETLTPEQYVRNVVEILFTPARMDRAVVDRSRD